MKKITTDLIARLYEEADAPVSNDELYALLQQSTGLSDAELNAQKSFGSNEMKTSAVKHKVRWYQEFSILPTVPMQGVVPPVYPGSCILHATEPIVQPLRAVFQCSEYGLSLLTRGPLWDATTPRSYNLACIGPPLSACSTSL